MPVRQNGAKPLLIVEVTPLRGETKERWRELCEQAILEQDPDKFLATIEELLEVLEDREERRRNMTRLRIPRKETSHLSCPVA